MRFISLLGMFRLIHIFRAKRVIEEHFHFVEKFPSITTLVKLLFLIFTMAHYCCCGFYFVGDYISNNDYNNNKLGIYSWIDAKNLRNASGVKLYIESLYFSFITI